MTAEEIRKEFDQCIPDGNSRGLHYYSGEARAMGEIAAQLAELNATLTKATEPGSYLSGLFDNTRDIANALGNMADRPVRSNARTCDHCHKELPIGQSVYWRGALLHQECRVPFIVAKREATT